MALEFTVKKYKVTETFKLKYEENNKPKEDKIDILITYKEAEEITKMVEGNMSFDRFAEILFKGKLDFVKEKTGLSYEDCVLSVGFQLTTKLFKDKVSVIKSSSSMQEFLKKN